MSEKEPQKSWQDTLFFIFLFVTCILGSVGIFIFAVGMETGNSIVSQVMAVLVEHAMIVFALFMLFNLLLVGIFKIAQKNQNKSSQT